MSNVCLLYVKWREDPNLSSNSNRITFDPFLAKKTSKIGKILIFDTFFCRKGVKCCPIWILGPDLESSRHFTYNRHPFDMILKLWFFNFTCTFKKLQIAFAIKKSLNFQLKSPNSWSAASIRDSSNMLTAGAKPPQWQLQPPPQSRQNLVTGGLARTEPGANKSFVLPKAEKYR